MSVDDEPSHSIFPTYVGVSPQEKPKKADSINIPHVCGGEPETAFSPLFKNSIFPTYVGVSLSFSR